MVRWSMHEEPRQKMKLQHTTTVWYGGSYINRHNELTDTSIQMLSNAKYLAHLLMFHILGWYGQPCHKE